VRQAAKYALGKLESEALERHADTFIAKLDNEKAAIRVSALGTLVKFKPAALKVAAPVPPLCALSL
jgi:HEAT repeat protein